MRSRTVCISKPLTIFDDTPLIPEIIAECVVNECEIFLNFTFPVRPDKYLVDRAEHIYQVNESFRRRLHGAGDKGRDCLYMFMRHWLSGYIKRVYPELFSELPYSYCVGANLPHPRIYTPQELEILFAKIEEYQAKRKDAK